MACAAGPVGEAGPRKLTMDALAKRMGVTPMALYRVVADRKDLESAVVAHVFESLSDDIVRIPSFTDDTVEAGETYFYAVTAVDDAPAENESERSALSEVTLAR